MSILRIGSVVATLLLVGAASAYAQTTGTICGTVTDPSGAGMSGVTVGLLLKGADQAQTSFIGTSPSGEYLFSNMASGTYTLTFESHGFMKTTRPGLVVSEHELRADQKLERSSVNDEVTAIAEAPVGYDRKVTTGGTFTKTVISSVPTGMRQVPSPCGAPR